MKYHLFLLLSLVLSCGNIFSQDSLTFHEKDLQGAKIVDRKYFTGSNLWGHIDGAADLFLEYGFRDLRYYEVEVNGINLDIEIYRFENPYESLGIYSVKKFGCRDDPGLNPMFCQTRYAISFPVSDYFVTIAGSQGTEQEQIIEKRIADILYAKPDDKGLTMNDIYPDSTGEFSFNDFRVIMGPLGFQNGLPDWSSRFGDYKGYICIWYSVGLDNKDIDVFLFNFKDPSQLNRMLKENGWQMNDDELTIEGKFNWLITRKGNMLMILKGDVPAEALRDLRSLE